MQQENGKSTSQVIIFARHIVGMSILALASPLVCYSSEPVSYWLAGWLAPLAISTAALGLYALFFTRHAKHSWRQSFFTLAWVLVALSAAAPWVSTLRERQAASQSASASPRTTSSPKATNTPKTDQDLMLEEYSNALATAQFELRSAGVNLSGEKEGVLDVAILSFAQEAAQLGLEDRVGDIAASRYALEKAKLQILQKYGQKKSQSVSKKSATGAPSTFDDLDAAGIGVGYKPPTTSGPALDELIAADFKYQQPAFTREADAP
jgi:hypothetical protein